MALKIITYRGWKRFWGRAFGWFSSQFDSIRSVLNGLDVNVDLSDVAKQGEDEDVSLTSLDFKTDRLFESIGETEDKVHDTGNKILGHATVINCETAFPSCRFNNLYNLHMDGEKLIISNIDTTIIPQDLTTDSLVKASDLDEEDVDIVIRSVDSPFVTYENGKYVLNGVTEWMYVDKNKSYRCSGLVPLVYTPQGGSEIRGVLYLYDEYLEDVSNRDILTAIGNVTVDTSNLATKAVEQWLGLEESYEAEAKGGERTNNTVIDECKVRFQDAFNGLLPTGFTMPNSVTVDNLTYTGTTNS